MTRIGNRGTGSANTLLTSCLSTCYSPEGDEQDVHGRPPSQQENPRELGAEGEGRGDVLQQMGAPRAEQRPEREARGDRQGKAAVNKKASPRWVTKLVAQEIATHYGVALKEF